MYRNIYPIFRLTLSYFQVKGPYMTGMYRHKESSGQAYGPTFLMGYGPGDVKASYYPILYINNIFFSFRLRESSMRMALRGRGEASMVISLWLV